MSPPPVAQHYGQFPCPKCGVATTKVMSTVGRRRNRKCSAAACHAPFSTYEVTAAEYRLLQATFEVIRQPAVLNKLKSSG